MKTIKAITDFGIKEVKTIGTKKEISGEFWICAEVPCKYMNAKEPLTLRKVIHFNTGTNLPIRGMSFNAPAKDYLKDAETFLSRIPLDAVKKEISNYEILNQ